jgi:carboxyl-terminal processing protease
MNLFGRCFAAEDFSVRSLLKIGLAVAVVFFPSIGVAQTDTVLAIVRTAVEQIREKYVDQIDEEKVFAAALKGLQRVPGFDARLIGPTGAVAGSAEEKRALLVRRVEIALGRIRDTARADHATLTDAAINGMIAVLDPHTRYINAKAWRENQALSGQASVGLSLTLADGAVRVVSAVADGPASRAGVLAGDTLIAIDRAPVAGMELRDVVGRLRGPVDSEIVLTLARAGSGGRADVTIKRAPVVQQQVQGRLSDGIGHVVLSGFNSHTAAHLKGTLEKLRNEGARGFVLDLRGNPGGLLSAAVEVAGLFLGNKPIASGRARGREVDRYAGDIAEPLTDKVVVLVDAKTASGAEVVAAALQHYGRAVVVGARTAGAGTVQTILSLGEAGGALRLTTSRLHLASGAALERGGVTPDRLVEAGRDVAKELQLEKALEMVRSGERR